MPLFGRGGILTRPMLERARAVVWKELEQAGLATPALARVRVTMPLIHLGERVGYYLPGTPGTIAVPALSLGRLHEYRGAAPWTGVRDILRHEYAHALADHHPELVERAAFERTFGGPHDLGEPVEPYAFHSHVSDYAASAPAEDFAETVMVYLRIGGDIEAYRNRRGLYRKLVYVSGLPRLLRGERGAA